MSSEYPNDDQASSEDEATADRPVVSGSSSVQINLHVPTRPVEPSFYVPRRTNALQWAVLSGLLAFFVVAAFSGRFAVVAFAVVFSVALGISLRWNHRVALLQWEARQEVAAVREHDLPRGDVERAARRWSI